jgi:hypothetical protein
VTRMDLDYHRVAIELDSRCAAAAALWYWQPPMLGALFMPPAPDLAGVHPLGAPARGPKRVSGGLPRPAPHASGLGNELQKPSCQEAFEKAPRGGITSIRAGAGLFKLAERGPPGCRWPSARQPERDLEEPFPVVPGTMALEVRKTALLVDQINFESEADSLVP